MLTTGNKSESEIKLEKENRMMSGVNRWASFYRANPHRFAKDYLGLNLKIFQQIILCMMFRFANATYLASRGGGKSFLISIFCVIYCILYPDTRICVASKTRGQATEILEKIRDKLIPNSPNLRLEVRDVFINQANSFIAFKNGSQVVVVTSGESARHNRATVLVVDEFRLVDKNTIDTILRKFLTAPRHPGYLDKLKYQGYPMERTKEIYASSCWYESHWSYEHVRTYVLNMLYGRSYFCCAMPYQLAIKENLLDRIRVDDEMSESTFNSVSFQMEMEALFFGQGDGGLYNFDEIDKNRKLKYAYYPRFVGHKIADKRIYIPPKAPGEIRLLSADIALMSSAKNRNDATSIFMNQMLPFGNGKYAKNIFYTENNEGLRTDIQALNIRKLFSDYESDYLVIDCRGLGLGVVDALMSDLYDAGTGETYPAISCCNNEEIAKRCVLKNAPKVIWAVHGTSEFNSQCAVILREAFRQGEIKLLMSEYGCEEYLSELKGWDKLTSSDRLLLQLPYIHTSLLINELINLGVETRNGVVRIKEKPGTRKDRYSSLSYNIYVAKELERDQSALRAKKTMTELIMQFKPPQLKSNYST